MCIQYFIKDQTNQKLDLGRWVSYRPEGGRREAELSRYDLWQVSEDRHWVCNQTHVDRDTCIGTNLSVRIGVPGRLGSNGMSESSANAPKTVAFWTVPTEITTTSKHANGNIFSRIFATNSLGDSAFGVSNNIFSVCAKAARASEPVSGMVLNKIWRRYTWSQQGRPTS